MRSDQGPALRRSVPSGSGSGTSELDAGVLRGQVGLLGPDQAESGPVGCGEVLPAPALQQQQLIKWSCQNKWRHGF